MPVKGIYILSKILRLIVGLQPFTVWIIVGIESVTLLRQAASLLLITVGLAVTKETKKNIDRQQPDEPDQGNQRSPVHDRLSHGCIVIRTDESIIGEGSV